MHTGETLCFDSPTPARATRTVVKGPGFLPASRKVLIRTFSLCKLKQVQILKIAAGLDHPRAGTLSKVGGSEVCRVRNALCAFEHGGGMS